MAIRWSVACAEKNLLRTMKLEYLRADIPIATKVTLTIYVCGERCQKSLLTDKMSLRRLQHGIDIARKENRKRAIKAMGRRFGMLAMIVLASCAYKPKPTRPDKLRARYESESNKKLNEWLDAEHPRKVVPTGEKKRKRFKK